MLNCASAVSPQIPLIHIVDEDDQLLLNSSDAEWYKILHYFLWEDYREIAARYYDALYHFNLLEAQKREEKKLNRAESWDESKEEAIQRFLFDRPTINKSVPVIHDEEFEVPPFRTVNPSSLAPGIVPNRLGGKKPRGHKASILGLPRQGVPLDAAAIADGATFDGETLFPHVERLFEHLPEVEPWVDRVLYDSACDNKVLKEKFQDEWGIDLKASFNPRRRKTITDNLPRGMEKITPYGTVICKGGCEMDYKGARYESEKFIYQAPTGEDNTPVCLNCEHKLECCPHSNIGRIINVSFDLLPHIDSDAPPMAKRFKAIMSRRPSVERMIKRLKCDLSDDRLRKRGNASFQAYLDKTMIAFHILLRN